MKESIVLFACALIAYGGSCASLEERVAALEKWRDEQVAVAESNRLVRVEARKRMEEAAKESAKRAKEVKEFNEWYRSYTEKYGRLVIVSVDTNTNEYVYRRADGVEVRKVKPKDVGGRQRTRTHRRREAK